ncbi:MAG: cysteine dioxygenase family protein [Phycisphaerales bacterium]|nr:cysteine dioxygenase family protein [Phycisphaerales bacterium]
MPVQQTQCGISPPLADIVGYLEGLRGRADLGVLADLLEELDITRHDIAPACVFGARGYRRNTIARGEWFELLALCWRSGDCTPIHDHEGSSCAFKVIEGQGTEIRYERTASGLVCPIGRAMLDEGTVCAAEDNDIHQVANNAVDFAADITNLSKLGRLNLDKRRLRKFCQPPGNFGRTGLWSDPLFHPCTSLSALLRTVQW